MVPVLNGMKTLPRCFESIRKAIPNLYIIAVDGGSTDGSYEWLQDHADIVFKQRRWGIGEARNQGFRLVEGPWMVTFDSDVIFPPNWLRAVKRYVKPRVASISGQLIFGAPDEPRIAAYYREWYRVRRNMVFVTMGNNLVRTEAVRDIGGFSLLGAGEDKDMQLKFLQRGWEWVNVPDLEAYNPRNWEEDLVHNRWWGRGMARLYPNPVYGFGYTMINLLYTPYMATKGFGGVHLMRRLIFLLGYIEGWKFWTFRNKISSTGRAGRLCRISPGPGSKA